jgi:hypothetical protein
MRYTSLDSAVEEAERFLRKAKHLQKRMKVTREQWPQHPHVHIDDHEQKSTGGDIAAVRRSSLDLSKALAVLRRST